jgi:D-arabinose 1-dehydrogenase-like Zn-dependent alcohol dehydrogenase
MKTMPAVQVTRAGGPIEWVEGQIPEPGPRQVRITFSQN